MENINEDKLAVGFIIAGDSVNISGQLRKSGENATPEINERDFLTFTQHDPIKLTNSLVYCRPTLVTNPSTLDAENPGYYAVQRSWTTDEDLRLGVTDVLLEKSSYWTFEAEVIAVIEFPIGSTEPIAVMTELDRGPVFNTQIFKCNDLSEIPTGGFPTSKAGYVYRTKIPALLYLLDNKLLNQDARHKGFFGKTGSGKSHMVASEFVRYLPTEMNFCVFEPKLQIINGQLGTSKNFRKRIKETGRELLPIYLDQFQIKPDIHSFKNLINTNNLWDSKYVRKMKKDDKVQATEVFTDIIFDEQKKSYQKWMQGDMSDIDFLKNILQELLDNHMQRIYAPGNARTELEGSIRALLNNNSKLKSMARNLIKVKFLFEEKKNVKTIDEIVDNFLLGHKTITYIIPKFKEVNNLFKKDDFNAIYKFLVSKIIEKVENHCSYPVGKYKNIKQFNACFVIDEAHRLFPSGNTDNFSRDERKTIEKFYQMLETYRSKGISAWLAVPDPMSINEKIRKRIFDHDLYIGSKLTSAGAKEIKDQITNPNRYKDLIKMPSPTHIFDSKEGVSKMKNFHFFLKGRLNPLDPRDEGFILTIDLEDHS